MRILRSLLFAIFVLTMIAGCATYPGHPPSPTLTADSKFSLPNLEAGKPKLALRDDRRVPKTSDIGPGCGEVIEFPIGNFSPSPIDYFSKSVPAQIDVADKDGTTAAWIAGKDIALREFRAVTGKVCRAPAYASKHAAMATVSPLLGPLFGMAMDSIANHFDRRDFVHLRIVVSFGGKEFDAASSTTRLEGPPERLFEDIANDVSRFLAQKVVEQVTEKEAAPAGTPDSPAATDAQ